MHPVEPASVNLTVYLIKTNFLVSIKRPDFTNYQYDEEVYWLQQQIREYVRSFSAFCGSLISKGASRAIFEAVD